MRSRGDRPGLVGSADERGADHRFHSNNPPMYIVRGKPCHLPYNVNASLYLRAEEGVLMEPPLQKLTLLSGGDAADGLYPIATRATGHLASQLIFRGVSIEV